MKSAKATREHMGKHNMSKTVSPHNFDESKERPQRALAVCRSWCIWRARQGAFLAGSAARQAVFHRELALLRSDLAGMGAGGRTGNLRADALIMQWTPDAFEPQ